MSTPIHEKEQFSFPAFPADPHPNHHHHQGSFQEHRSSDEDGTLRGEHPDEYHHENHDRHVDNDHLRKTTVGGVKLFWFGIWLEIVWLTLWLARIIAKCIPYPMGILSSLFTNNSKKWRDLGRALEVPATLFFLVIRGSYPMVYVNKAQKNARSVFNKVGDVAGKVAGDFTGRAVTSSTHPHQVILQLLNTTTGSQVLARRLYRTFVHGDAETILAEDLTLAFDNEEEAEAAFTMFDKDLNGDISMEELETVCVEIGRERKAITASLKDLDSVLQGDDYFVKEISLLFTEFKKMEGHVVQAPNSYLNTLFILNQRRSGGLAEAVPITVKFGTTIEQIEQLREELVRFVKSEKREYQGKIITEVTTIYENYSITFNVVFFYKSSWQNELLRLQRRNKFIIAMICAMEDLGIQGPRQRLAGFAQENPSSLMVLIHHPTNPTPNNPTWDPVQTLDLSPVIMGQWANTNLKPDPKMHQASTPTHPSSVAGPPALNPTPAVAVSLSPQ
ncbi:hypothetical protein DID88_002722 [Monilinia fructigena]|uniref:EF-hand domain-containing protein n=1 Tax=Monilinia fructigena TaxID=38457 RepID=A0A395IQG4_9HELO|nr:hypothetical protein DID88_002722 [Monilinia fructigena]